MNDSSSSPKSPGKKSLTHSKSSISQTKSIEDGLIDLDTEKQLTKSTSASSADAMLAKIAEQKIGGGDQDKRAGEEMRSVSPRPAANKCVHS